MELKGKNVLVTGGALRIGKAICESLAARGANIVVHYRDSRGPAEALVASLGAGSSQAWCVQGDLARDADCERIVAQASALSGGIHGLVNNASLFDRESLADSTPASTRREFDVNLFAPMTLTRCFAAQLPAMPGACVGHVVNLLDRRVAGIEGGCMPYLLSKKALEAFTQAAAVELAPAIAVNAVAPGAILPPAPGAGVASESAGEALLAHGCTPADVAEAVAYLVASNGITGRLFSSTAGSTSCEEATSRKALSLAGPGRTGMRTDKKRW